MNITPEEILKTVEENIGKNADKDGFFDLEKSNQCTHRSHRPPMHLHIPQGKGYKHICPNCGAQTILIPPQISY
jgi:DNA repair exonuclease SbcCD ATPase subunit